MARYRIQPIADGPPGAMRLETVDGEAAGAEATLAGNVRGALEQLATAPDGPHKAAALQGLRAIAEAHLVPEARTVADGLAAFAAWQQGNRGGPAGACPDPDRFEGQFFAVWKKRGEGPWDVAIAARPGASPPEDMARLYVDIIDTLSVLRILYPHPDDAPDGRRHRVGRVGRWWMRLRGRPADTPHRIARKFVQYFDRVFGVAAAGLAQGQVALAALALQGLQREIVDREAGEVKNAYIRRLGLFATTIAVPAVALYLSGGLLPWVAGFRDFFLLLAGCSVGAWLSFSMRRVTLGFRDLILVEEDRLDPGIRILFVMGLTVIVGLTFWTGMVVINIGDFSTAFAGAPARALLIGLFCGVAETGLSTAVGRRASEFVDRIGAPPQASR